VFRAPGVAVDRLTPDHAVEHVDPAAAVCPCNPNVEKSRGSTLDKHRKRSDAGLDRPDPALHSQRSIHPAQLVLGGGDDEDHA